MSAFSDKLNGPYKQAALFLSPLAVAIGTRYGVDSTNIQMYVDIGCLIAQALMPSVLTLFKKKA